MADAEGAEAGKAGPSQPGNSAATIANLFMKQLIIAIAFFIAAGVALTGCRRATAGSSDPSYILKVDSLIEQADAFQQAKLANLAKLRMRIQPGCPLDTLYALNDRLFEEFFTYNTDSATRYIDRSIALAKATGDPKRIARSQIKKDQLLTSTGLLTEAKLLMDSIDRQALANDTNLLIDYYNQMMFLYSHLGNYAGGDGGDYYAKERTYKDSIMMIVPKDHPDYLWFRGWDILGTSKKDSTLIPALEAQVKRSSLNTLRDAKTAYILGRLYAQEGDTAKYAECMALSSMADIRLANCDIASLEDLAKILFSRGDIDHAYAYIDYALNKAISFPNRVRAVGMTETLDSINNAYQQKVAQQQRRTNQYLMLVCVLVLVLIATVAIIIMQNRRLASRRRRLDTANKNLSRKIGELSESRKETDEANEHLNEANARLNEANAQLTKLNSELLSKNSELNEANYVKEEYIGYIFTICSNYIRKLEDLRKSIHSKAVKKKYKEIELETTGVDSTKDELKDFYRSFDSVFLHIYPDFVSDFNSLLQPDKQIVLKEGELLNTELRIYALVRLGITDSVKIAEFLHCSPQTVYNNRFRVRNKSTMPRKEFVDSVRTLGTYMEKPS